jgi:uncharacterized MAPEG superfamily protein
MTFPFWCLVVCCFIPHVLAATTGYFKTKQFGTTDNNNPRAQTAALEGAGARANAAQENAWEALSIFAVAVFVAHLAGADPRLSAIAAGVFLGTRVLHPILYIADIATARSIVFLVGLGCNIWLFVLAARA